MRSLLAILFSLTLLLANSSGASKKPFAGVWDFNAGNASSFTLELTQAGNHIEGYHTAIAHRGNRIDAILPKEGKPSITGDVVAGVAHIHFRSGYSDATGEATLTLKGNKLEWEITRSSGAHYLPTSCILRRP
jgi:hypothetical protein